MYTRRVRHTVKAVRFDRDLGRELGGHSSPDGSGAVLPYVIVSQP